MSLFSRSTEGERINLRSKARSYLDSGMSHLAEAFSTAASRKFEEAFDSHERVYDSALDWAIAAQEEADMAVQNLEAVQQRDDDLFAEGFEQDMLDSEIALKEDVDRIWEEIAPDPRNWVEALFPSEQVLDEIAPLTDKEAERILFPFDDEVEEIWKDAPTRAQVDAIIAEAYSPRREAERVVPTFTTEQDRDPSDIYSPAEEFDPQFASTFDQTAHRELISPTSTLSQMRVMTAPLSPMLFVNPNRIGY